MRRVAVGLVFLSVVLGLIAGVPNVFSQGYPNRTIQLVIPGAPGLMQDIPGRLISEEVGKMIKEQMVVVNKPGASMTLGTDAVAKSKKDGYTLLFTATAPLVYPRIFNPESLPYNTDKDLEPLGGRALISFTVAVQESSPWKTFAELIDYAKKNPEKLRVGTPGIETAANFDLQIIQTLTDTRFIHIPITKGPAVSLLGGHIEVVVLPITEVISYTQAGKLRILLTSNKLAELPNVPTPRELGYKQDLLPTWFGFYGPSGMPEEVKRVLVPAIEKAIRNPELKSRLEKLNFFVDYKSPSEMKKLITEEYETVNAIAQKLGLAK
ncbi:MAG TPA: tripartite tricarboxylate transporter substrate binding protein [Thermodesulfobacteriota bacterium]|nr:tripartite tricarboxylate transporter substrate binding protein [Thermodesulfobacteriota bacterium]